MTTKAVRSPDTAADAGGAGASVDAAGLRDPDAVWRKFETVMAASRESAAFAPAPRPERAPLVAAAPAAVSPYETPPSPALTTEAAPKRRAGPWRYRLQGAAITGVIVLSALTAERFTRAAAPEGAPVAVAPVDPSAAFADAFAQNALVATAPAQAERADAPSVSAALAAASLDVAVADQPPEAEVIARIAAADPPYRVVLHLAPESSPREVARLETAIRAWGFKPPEQRAAAESVTLSEVVYHAPQDREAATIVARIADSILAQAVLTPPESAPPQPAGELAGRLDVYVMTR